MLCISVDRAVDRPPVLAAYVLRSRSFWTSISSNELQKLFHQAFFSSLPTIYCSSSAVWEEYAILHWMYLWSDWHWSGRAKNYEVSSDYCDLENCFHCLVMFADSGHWTIYRENTIHWNLKNIKSTEQRTGRYCHQLQRRWASFCGLWVILHPPAFTLQLEKYLVEMLIFRIWDLVSQTWFSRFC